jgi:hypothetical protein
MSIIQSHHWVTLGDEGDANVRFVLHSKFSRPAPALTIWASCLYTPPLNLHLWVLSSNFLASTCNASFRRSGESTPPPTLNHSFMTYALSVSRIHICWTAKYKSIVATRGQFNNLIFMRVSNAQDLLRDKKLEGPRRLL